MTRWRLLQGRVLRSLWFRPALFAAAALVAALVAPYAARLLPDNLNRLIGLEGVYDLLTALAGTLLAVATFSLGIFASSLNAAAQNATPRVRPLLAEDPTTRNAVSTFIGGFVFGVAGIVVLSTGYDSDAAKVLLFFVTVFLILALIVALVRWIGRLSRLGDVMESIDLAEEATRKSLLDLAADPFFGGAPSEAPPPGGDPVLPQAPGFVQVIDVDALAALAEELGVDLHVAARPGAWVGPGRPLLVAAGRLAEEDRRRLREPFMVGGQRTFEADPRFGLVVLSEIASRALSPGINDPGTAIDVVTTSTRLLSEWAEAAGQARPRLRHPRLHIQPIPVDDLLRDAFRWIARDGARMAEVQLWIQKGLLTLATQDPTLFGPPARALSREALSRAEEGLSLPADLEPLRALAAEIDRA